MLAVKASEDKKYEDCIRLCKAGLTECESLAKVDPLNALTNEVHLYNYITRSYLSLQNIEEVVALAVKSQEVGEKYQLEDKKFKEAFSKIREVREKINYRQKTLESTNAARQVVSLCDELVKLYPHSFPIIFKFRSEVNWYLGHLELAEDDAKIVLERFEHPAGFLLLARVKNAQNKYVEAYQHLISLLMSHDGYLDGEVQKAAEEIIARFINCEYAHKRDSAEFIQLAVDKTQPSFEPTLFYQRAEKYEAQKKYDAAILDIKIAIWILQIKIERDRQKDEAIFAALKQYQEKLEALEKLKNPEEKATPAMPPSSSDRAEEYRILMEKLKAITITNEHDPEIAIKRAREKIAIAIQIVINFPVISGKIYTVIANTYLRLATNLEKIRRRNPGAASNIRIQEEISQSLQKAAENLKIALDRFQDPYAYYLLAMKEIEQNNHQNVIHYFNLFFHYDDRQSEEVANVKIAREVIYLYLVSEQKLGGSIDLIDPSGEPIKKENCLDPNLFLDRSVKYQQAGNNKASLYDLRIALWICHYIPQYKNRLAGIKADLAKLEKLFPDEDKEIKSTPASITTKQAKKAVRPLEASQQPTTRDRLRQKLSGGKKGISHPQAHAAPIHSDAKQKATAVSAPPSTESETPETETPKRTRNKNRNLKKAATKAQARAANEANRQKHLAEQQAAADEKKKAQEKAAERERAKLQKQKEDAEKYDKDLQAFSLQLAEEKKAAEARAKQSEKEAAELQLATPKSGSLSPDSPITTLQLDSPTLTSESQSNASQSPTFRVDEIKEQPPSPPRFMSAPVVFQQAPAPQMQAAPQTQVPPEVYLFSEMKKQVKIPGLNLQEWPDRINPPKIAVLFISTLKKQKDTKDPGNPKFTWGVGGLALDLWIGKDPVKRKKDGTSELDVDTVTGGNMEQMENTVRELNQTRERYAFKSERVQTKFGEGIIFTIEDTDFSKDKARKKQLKEKLVIYSSPHLRNPACQNPILADVLSRENFLKAIYYDDFGRLFTPCVKTLQCIPLRYVELIDNDTKDCRVHMRGVITRVEYQGHYHQSFNFAYGIQLLLNDLKDTSDDSNKKLGRINYLLHDKVFSRVNSVDIFNELHVRGFAVVLFPGIDRVNQSQLQELLIHRSSLHKIYAHFMILLNPQEFAVAKFSDASLKKLIQQSILKNPLFVNCFSRDNMPKKLAKQEMEIGEWVLPTFKDILTPPPPVYYDPREKSIVDERGRIRENTPGLQWCKLGKKYRQIPPERIEAPGKEYGLLEKLKAGHQWCRFKNKVWMQVDSKDLAKITAAPSMPGTYSLGMWGGSGAQQQPVQPIQQPAGATTLTLNPPTV